MSDPMRDELRTAIAELIAEAPDPPPLEAITLLSRPPPGPTSRLVWALVSFAFVLLVVGSVAWLRPSGGEGGPTLDLSSPPPPGGDSLESVYAIPGYLPPNLELQAINRFGFDQEITLLYTAPEATDPGSRELVIHTTDTVRFENPTPTVIRDRLAAAYPWASVSQTMVRGSPGFLIEGGTPDTDGWESAVLVVERPGLVTQIHASGIEATEVLTVARSLIPASRDAFVAWASDHTTWDLRVFLSGDVGADLIERIEDLSGVAEVSAQPRMGVHEARRLSALVYDSSGSGAPTTTAPSLSTTQAETPSTVVATVPEWWEVFVTLGEEVDPEEVARAIQELVTAQENVAKAQIDLSLALEEEQTKKYLAAVTSDAGIIQSDPLIYQATPGPEPRFNPATLGQEMELTPASADTPISRRQVARLLEGVSQAAEGSMESLDGPIIHVGRLDDGAFLAVVFDGGSYYLERAVAGATTATGGGSRVHRYGISGWSGSNDGPTYVRVRVPLDTSVAVLEFSDGTRLWQRPVAGFGFFRVDLPSIEEPAVAVTALDAEGDLIGYWRP